MISSALTRRTYEALCTAVTCGALCSVEHGVTGRLWHALCAPSAARASCTTQALGQLPPLFLFPRNINQGDAEHHGSDMGDDIQY